MQSVNYEKKKCKKINELFVSILYCSHASETLLNFVIKHFRKSRN